MPGAQKKHGKGPRSKSRIGRRYKNKLWSRKKTSQDGTPILTLADGQQSAPEVNREPVCNSEALQDSNDTPCSEPCSQQILTLEDGRELPGDNREQLEDMHINETPHGSSDTSSSEPCNQAFLTYEDGQESPGDNWESMEDMNISDVPLGSEPCSQPMLHASFGVESAVDENVSALESATIETSTTSVLVRIYTHYNYVYIVYACITAGMF